MDNDQNPAGGTSAQPAPPASPPAAPPAGRPAAARSSAPAAPARKGRRSTPLATANTLLPVLQGLPDKASRDAAATKLRAVLTDDTLVAAVKALTEGVHVTAEDWDAAVTVVHATIAALPAKG